MLEQPWRRFHPEAPDRTRPSHHDSLSSRRSRSARSRDKALSRDARRIGIGLVALCWAGGTPAVSQDRTGPPLDSPPIATADELDRARALESFVDRARRLSSYRVDLAEMGPYTAERTVLEEPDPRSQIERFVTGWDATTQPLDHDAASHLMGRAMIGPRFVEIDDAVGRGLDAQVARLLTPRPEPESPGPWATMPHPDTEGWTDEQINDLFDQYWKLRDPLRLWWAQQFLDTEDSATESMTLFWHEHFATSIDGVQLPQSMFVQNRTLRSHALGNFKTLVEEIAVDPAMLIWLDGIKNRKGRINENFGRELLELFTMGIGWYTEDDVRAAARAFTGWTTPDGVTAVFTPEEFDDGEKTFLGQTGNWNGQDIIDIIFEHPQTARFLAAKLYRWYIDEFPNESSIDELAAILRANDYEVQPALETMWKSKLFYHPELRGSLIADGIDRSIGALRSLEVEGVALDDPYSHPSQWVLYCMDTSGHILFEPPDVSGWPGYRTWINSTTLPWRKTLDAALLDGELEGWDLYMQSDVMAWAEQLTDPNDAEQLIEDTIVQFFGLPPTNAVRAVMTDELLQGSEPWEWSLFDPQAEDRIRGLLRLTVRLPDYQVK